MAFAYEHRDTEEGDFVGIEGGVRERLFMSIVDAESDDVMTKVLEQAPLYSLHPRSTARLYSCTGHRIGRWRAYLTREVYALYEPITINLAGGQIWTMTVRSVSRTEQLERSLLRDRYDDFPNANLVRYGELIGSYAYEPITSAAEATHKAKTAAKMGGEQLLYRSTDGFRRRPAEVPAQDTSLQFSATVAALSFQQILGLHGFKKHVNGRTWNGFPPRTLLCLDPEVTRRVGTMPGQTGEGLVFDVGVEFVINEDEWTPFAIDELYAEGGAEYHVYNTNGVQEPPKRYKKFYAADFNDIFSLLGTPDPVTGRTIPRSFASIKP